MAKEYDLEGVQRLYAAILTRAYLDYVESVADMMAIEDGLDKHSGLNLYNRWIKIYDSATLQYVYKHRGNKEEAQSYRISRYYRTKESEYAKLCRFFTSPTADAYAGVMGGGTLIMDRAEKLLSEWREDRVSTRTLYGVVDYT